MFPAARPQTSLSKNQTGQGIIEIVVVLALAAILILALVALSVRSNRSANFAKAEDQAARLAQEGVEIIQDIRNDKPDHVLDTSGSVVNWNWIYTQDFSADQTANFTACSSDECLDFSQSAKTVTLGGRDFTRSIFVNDDSGDCNNPSTPATVKQFRVQVVWVDSAGDHTITTSSCMRR